MLLLNVPHHQQRRDADCLATCAAMALEYLAIPFRYERLLRILHVESAGASFFNLNNLTKLGVFVKVEEGDMDLMQSYLDKGLPIIVSVETRELPYWRTTVRHAVAVIGADEGVVYLNDPAFAKAPQIVERKLFELAWLQRDYLYGVIGLVEIE